MSADSLRLCMIHPTTAALAHAERGFERLRRVELSCAPSRVARAVDFIAAICGSKDILLEILFRRGRFCAEDQGCGADDVRCCDARPGARAIEVRDEAAVVERCIFAARRDDDVTGRRD